MSLTREQLRQIEVFIARKGFTYTDVKLEILDHVACAVEEKIGKDPDLSLEKALSLVHADFGVYGFSVIEDAIKRSLNKVLMYTIAKVFRDTFLWSRLVLVLGFSFLIFQAFRFWENIDVWYYCLLLAQLFWMICFFWRTWSEQRRFKNMLSFRMASNFTTLTTMMAIQLVYYDLIGFLGQTITDPIFQAGIFTLLAALFVLFDVSAYRYYQSVANKCLAIRSRLNLVEQ